MTKLFRLKRQKRGDLDRIPDKNQHYGQEYMGPDETALSVRKIAESMWRPIWRWHAMRKRML